MRRPRFVGSHTRRQGLSRLEAVVAGGMTALLGTILLPAVLTARSGARMEQSRDNLRQIGKAVADHEKTHDRLPYGTYHDKESPTGSCDPRYHMFYSGWTAILPWVGEQDLFNHYDPALPYRDETDADGDGWTNRRVTESRPSVFIDPEMPAPENPPHSGWSSYAWSGGNNGYDNGGNISGGSGGTHDGSIVHARQGGVKFADITDGTSLTFLAGDAHYTLKGMRAPGAVGKPSVKADADKAKDEKAAEAKPVADAEKKEEAKKDEVKKDDAKPKVNTGQNAWGAGHYPRSHLSTNTPPNTHDSAHSNPNMVDWYKQGAFGFRSSHPGGCHFVLCDGSVKFINETIAMPVYKALGSRAGGESIEPNDVLILP
jgi:prepilin-type processing-associated H-X9-DG protein